MSRKSPVSMSLPNGIRPGANVLQLPPPAVEARASPGLGAGCAGSTGTGVPEGEGVAMATAVGVIVGVADGAADGAGTSGTDAVTGRAFATGSSNPPPPAADAPFCFFNFPLGVG